MRQFKSFEPRYSTNTIRRYGMLMVGVTGAGVGFMAGITIWMWRLDHPQLAVMFAGMTIVVGISIGTLSLLVSNLGSIFSEGTDHYNRTLLVLESQSAELQRKLSDVDRALHSLGNTLSPTPTSLDRSSSTATSADEPTEALPLPAR